jgi:hypothetical protein
LILALAKKTKIKVKSGGQECPPHTSHLQLRERRKTGLEHPPAT